MDKGGTAEEEIPSKRKGLIFDKCYDHDGNKLFVCKK